MESESTPPDPLENADWAAIGRFLTGESPPQEEAAMRRWLQEEPEREEAVARLDEIINALKRPPISDLEVQLALSQVQARIRGDEVQTAPQAFSSEISRTRARWRNASMQAAAVLVLLLAGAIFVRQVLPSRQDAVEMAEGRVIETAVGQQLSTRLSDGTRVTLGPSSLLSVPSGYGEGDRVVELTGEALFEVVHDDIKPFIVSAGVATVRDLGTAFALRTGPAGDVRVSVTEGVVLLHSANRSPEAGLTLRAGDRGLLQPGADAVAERGVPLEDDLAWTRGQLVFNETPLPAVAADLFRWYGVDVRLANTSMESRRLTASFAGEPVDVVIETIAIALGAQVQLHGDTVLFSFPERSP
jgi:transmembrane sensor